MASVLTAANLGVGLGAVFLFPKRNLLSCSWKFGLGAFAFVTLCFVLICLGTNTFHGNRKFLNGCVCIFYPVFGSGSKVLAFDLHRKN